MSSWEISYLYHISNLHFGDQTTGSLAIFPEQRVFCLWPMNFRNIGVNSMSPTTKGPSILYTVDQLQLATGESGVNPSKVQQGMKTWSSGGNLLVESCYSLELHEFWCHFWGYLASMKRWNVMMYIIGWRKWWLIVNLRSNPSRNLKRLGGRKGWDSATIGLGIWEGSAGNVKLRTKKNKSIKVSNYSHRIS